MRSAINRSRFFFYLTLSMFQEADDITRRKAHVAARIYAGAALYYGLIVLFYWLLKATPEFLRFFLSGPKEINMEVYMLFILLLPLLVPLVGMIVSKARSNPQMIAGTIVLALIMGSTGALLSLITDTDFLLIPIGAIALTFLLTAINCVIDPAHAFSTIMHILMFIEAGSLVITANTLFVIEWYGWAISAAMFFLTLYLTITPVEMGELLEEPEPGRINWHQILRGVNTISILSMILFYPHALGTGGTPIHQKKRRWMGPEEDR